MAHIQTNFFKYTMDLYVDRVTLCLTTTSFKNSHSVLFFCRWTYLTPNYWSYIILIKKTKRLFRTYVLQELIKTENMPHVNNLFRFRFRMIYFTWIPCHPNAVLNLKSLVLTFIIIAAWRQLYRGVPWWPNHF